jgi:competence protein ComGC
MKSSLMNEENAAGDFGAVYMILVFAIVALALVVVVKPMYKSAQKSIPKTTS